MWPCPSHLFICSRISTRTLSLRWQTCAKLTATEYLAVKRHNQGSQQMLLIWPLRQVGAYWQIPWVQLGAKGFFPCLSSAKCFVTTYIHGYSRTVLGTPGQYWGGLSSAGNSGRMLGVLQAVLGGTGWTGWVSSLSARHRDKQQWNTAKWLTSGSF